jgi:hypothetical protein
MGKATNIIDIIEGFKLGSLGAGKKPSREVEPDKPKREPKEGIRGFEFGTNRIEWTENLDGAWSHIFKDRPTWDELSDYEVDFWAYVKKENTFYVPTLEIALIDLDKEKRISTVIYKHEFLTMKEDGMAIKWLQGQRSAIKSEGAKALDFPENWGPVK